MNKKTIITALLALLCVTGLAKVNKTSINTSRSIKVPEAMVNADVIIGELKIDEVIMTDTATTLQFTMVCPQGETFRFVRNSYLVDEDGHHYPLRSAEGIALDAWFESPGTTEFKVHFDPMPQHVQLFDFIEADALWEVNILGIHEKGTIIKAPSIQELYARNPFTLPTDWLTSGSVTIRGRIEDYDAERMGFTSMEAYVYDVMVGDHGTQLIEIEPNGSFEKTMQLSYPMKSAFYVKVTNNDSNTDFTKMPFFARPGETINIVIRPNKDGQWECFYDSGSSHEVERLLKSDLRLTQMARPLSSFKGKFSEVNPIADQVWQNMLARIDMISRRDHFTPMEVNLALGEMQSAYAMALIDYAMNSEFRLMPFQQLEDGSWTRTLIDSVEIKTFADINNYKALDRIDFDNPLLMVSDDYFFTLNRVYKAPPVREAKQASLDNGIAMLHELTGKHDNLTAQLGILQEILDNFNSWRQNEETLPSIMEEYLSKLTHPYVRQKAEEFYQAKMSQKSITSPLPEGPGAEIISNIMAKYPGRYLVLDFWGMGCGGCRIEIQNSKGIRAEMGKRDDVKIVFIAGERTPGGSDAYKKYVTEWLADEETVCVSLNDFRHLQELLLFSAIPHSETFTPDGLRVREDVKIQSLFNIEMELQALKERLKK
ncbi:MAG: hypothetical protein IJV20_00585 [Prevotella sp.]|nr:hypothetical protein [Prevotella sp.]